MMEWDWLNDQLRHALNPLHYTPMGAFVRDVRWAGPAFTALHAVTMPLLALAIAAADLRLLGLRAAAPDRVFHALVRVALAAFIAALVSAVFLLCGAPDRYLFTAGFRWKVVFLLIAGLNVLLLYAMPSARRHGQEAGPPALVHVSCSRLRWRRASPHSRQAARRASGPRTRPRRQSPRQQSDRGRFETDVRNLRRPVRDEHPCQRLGVRTTVPCGPFAAHRPTHADVTSRPVKRSKKACAFVLRRADARMPRLLVLSFASHPELPRRLPGGTLEDDETPLMGVCREVSEETGLRDAAVVRKLGVRRYYKEFTHADVERHDYLLSAPDAGSLSFSHTVTGTGGDAGMTFDYAWIGPEELASVDEEFQRELTPEYLPELFAPDGSPAGDAESVVVVEYDASWPRTFHDQRALLEEVFGTTARIEHVGSTAVPGLGAKPIIDIMVGLPALSDAEARIQLLSWLGYEYVPDYEAQLPSRRYFRSMRDGRAFHLHCVVYNGAEWRRHIAFRDYLRDHPATAAEYFALKQSLAARHRSDRAGYTSAKRRFVDTVLERAGLGTSSA